MPTTTQPFEEDPDDEFAYDTDLLVLIDGANEPGGGMTITSNAQDATIVALIPWNKTRSAARHLCGYSYADDGAPYKLHREPPMCHPRWPNLRVSGVSFSGFGIKTGTRDAETGVFTPSNEDGYPLIEEPWFGPRGETLRSAQYEYALATIRYRSFGMMRFLLDEDIDDYTDEFKRFCTLDAQASVETLSADGASNLVFQESLTAGIAFPAPLAELLAKVSLTVRWDSVPHRYLSADPLVLNPTKIIERLGTWNSDLFIGYDIGTLLLLGFEADPVLYPVLTSDPLNDVPFVGWNIKFHFSLFDPPKGFFSLSGTQKRGHRIFPYRVTGKWFFATRENGTDELLPGSSHWRLMQHVDDQS